MGKNGQRYKGQAFYNAILKHGWDNIRHIVIASHQAEEDAKALERLWIKILGSSNKENGYNITQGGDGTTGISHAGEANPFYGRKHSDKAKQAISEYRKQYSKTHKSVRCRPVLQFDMSGILVGEYDSALSAEHNTGIDHSVIARVCNGKLNYTHGYVWAYKDSILDIEKVPSLIQACLFEKQKNIGQGNCKPVSLYDIHTGEIFKYRSASEAARKWNVHKDTIAYACRHNSIVKNHLKCGYSEVKYEQ